MSTATPTPPHVRAYYAAEHRIASAHADTLAPLGLGAVDANVAAYIAEIDRRAALRFAAVTALRASHLAALSLLLADDPTALESVQERVERLASRGIEGLGGALAALRAAPRNVATGAPVHHPAGTGACPSDAPCDECAAAYSEPEGPESVEGVEA